MEGAPVLEWLQAAWVKHGGELMMQAAGTLLGLAFGWIFWLRKALDSRRRLRKGQTDSFTFQMHVLKPVPGTNEEVLLFRNILSSTTVAALFENPAARELVRSLARKTTVHQPILRTKGACGYDVLNDAFTHAAGHLAIAPFPREKWLFAMTCEDRQAVRRSCVRCFLIRPRDLERFLDWEWCRDRVRVEAPWHWFRVVALRQMALQWKVEEEERAKRLDQETRMPLVDKHHQHAWVREMSAGVFVDEVCVGQAARIPWEKFQEDVSRLGLDLKTGVIRKR